MPGASERPAWRRKQPVVNYQANSSDTIDLHAGYQVRELLVRLSGTLTIGTAVATAVLEDAPYSILKRLEVMANGNTPLKTIGGKAALELTALRDRVLPTFVQPGTAVGNHPFSCLFKIQFWMPNAGLAMDGTLVDHTREGGITDLTLAADWGSESDLVTPGGSTVLSFATAPTLEIISHEVKRKPGDAVVPYAIFRERTISKTVDATNTDFTVDIHSGPGRNVVGCLIIAREAGVRTDGIINEISVKTEDETRFGPISGALVRELTDINFERGTARVGVYYVDIAPKQLLGHGVQTSDVSVLELSLDVTAGASSKLEIIPLEIISGGS